MAETATRSSSLQASSTEYHREAYIAPDIDSATGELMDTIRGTGGGCAQGSSAQDSTDQCNVSD